MATITTKEVISRIGIYSGAPEKNRVRKPHIKKMMKYNHLNLHLIAPQMCREYLETNRPLTLKGTGGALYLDLTELEAGSDPVVPKELRSVTFTGSDVTTMVPYKEAQGAEHFYGLCQYLEEEEYARWWLLNRGDKRVRILQGTEVTNETTLDLWFVREFNVDYSDETKEFDCPSELLEIYIMSVSKDVMLEEGNKAGAEGMAASIQTQMGLISNLTQIDTLKSQQQSILDAQNKDTRP